MSKLSSLALISFNVKGFKERNYDYLRDLFEKCDLLLLQETWLYKFEEDVVREVLRDSNYYCTSAMKEYDIDRQGRPFGGCAIIWKRTLTSPVSPIETLTPRVCAVTLNNINDKFLLLSVYMPVDNNNVLSVNEFTIVLEEISRLLKEYEGYKIIIGGDFNIDFKRAPISINTELLLNFMLHESLIVNNNVFDNDDFTFLSNTGSKSTIDHFMFTENCLEFLKTFKVLYDGNNLSDHFPIVLYVDISQSLTYLEETLLDNNDVFNWKAASDENIKNYKTLLDEMLSSVYIPDTIVNCNDRFCNSHNDFITQTLNDIINAMKISANLSIPKFSNKRNKGKPGWNNFVSFYKNKSMLWCKIWKEAGSPTHGELFEIRKLTRNKYHLAIKYIKRNKDNIIKDKVSHSLKSNNVVSFWKEINKLKNDSINSRSSVIDDCIGEMNITNLFKNNYYRLFNEFKFDGNEVNKNLEKEINNKCNRNNCNCNFDFSHIDILKSIKNLKNYKNDPILGLSSSNLILGSDLLNFYLATIFKLCITHGVSTDDINKSIIVPIPKNKSKALSDSNNYRGIAINTTVSKLFEYVLLDCISPYIKSNDYQFGFKTNHSTTLCSFILNQTIQYYNNLDSDVYALFLDASKAFDRVRLDKLIGCLLTRNVCPLVVRMIYTSYSLSTLSIKWGSVTSSPIKISNGVKQGGILSPYLFSIYLEPLIDEIIKSNFGCHVGSRPANVFAYADDVAVLSPTVTGLNHIIGLCEKFAKEYCINFNESKSFVMHFSNNYNIRNFDVNIIMNNKILI